QFAPLAAPPGARICPAHRMGVDGEKTMAPPPPPPARAIPPAPEPPISGTSERGPTHWPGAAGCPPPGPKPACDLAPPKKPPGPGVLACALTKIVPPGLITTSPCANMAM